MADTVCSEQCLEWNCVAVMHCVLSAKACIEQFLGRSVISVGSSQSCSFGSNQHECSIIVSEPGTRFCLCHGGFCSLS